MKKIIKIVISVAIVFVFVNDNIQMIKANKQTYIMNINHDMVEKNTGKNSERESQLEVSVMDDSTAKVVLMLDKLKYEGILYGDIAELDTGDYFGHYTYYSGELSNSNNNVFVDMDTYYTADDMFAIVTFYVIGDEDRSILYYGELTKEISNIAKAYCNLWQNNTYIDRFENERLNNNANKYSQNRSDYTKQYQGYNSTYLGNYLVGQISVIHQNYLANGSSAEIDVKVNTNTTNMNNYLIYNQGITSATIVRPYQVDVDVYGSEAAWNVPPGAYEPANSSTSYTIPLYFYAGTYLGIQSVNVTISTTTTTAQRLHNSSSTNYGKIAWTIRKTDGFTPSKSDGTYSSNNGFPFDVDLRYNGSVSYNTLTYINSRAKLTYRYLFYDNTTGETLTATISTSYFYKITNITVEP